MHDPIGPPAADTSPEARAPQALCPTCGRFGENGMVVGDEDSDSVRNAYYVCSSKHVFIVRWAEVA